MTSEPSTLGRTPKVSYVQDPSGIRTGNFQVKDPDGNLIIEIPKSELTLRMVIDSVYKIGYIRGMSKVLTETLGTIHEAKTLLNHYDNELQKVLDKCKNL